MFSVYCALGKVRNACTHYRLYTPLRAMSLNSEAVPLIEDLQSLTDSQVETANFHLYYMRASRGLIKVAHEYNRERTRRHPTKTFAAPHFIFDSDDHVEHLNIWNPRFVTLGTRMPDGTKMGPGDRVEVFYPDIGERIVLWEDGQERYGETMNVRANHSLVNLLKIFARTCSGVTASTEYLAGVYRRYGCKNVYVHPNSLLEEDYPEIRPERPKNVTIFWQGGHSHYEDWLTILDPLRRVMEKRPNARVVTWGNYFPAIRRAVPEGRFRHIPWVDYMRYTYRLATIGHHINLCPLADTEFNRAKSAIKWMESSAITRPAATLAANVTPYQAIQHGETGLLYDTPEEFEDLLLNLIDDGALRQRLARRAHAHVWDVYHAQRTAKPLAAWYRKMAFETMR